MNLRGVMILGLAMAGCAADTLPIHLDASWSGGDVRQVEDAAGLLGYGVDWTTTEGRGVVHMVLADEPVEIWIPESESFQWVCGEARELDVPYCSTRKGWSCRGNVRTTAHELGHILGLSHSDESGNLMESGEAGDSLTERQERQMDRWLGVLHLCRES